MIKQKPDTKLQVSQRELQINRDQVDTIPLTISEVYNKFIRKSGQKVLTDAEVVELQKQGVAEFVLKGRRRLFFAIKFSENWDASKPNINETKEEGDKLPS